MRPLLLAVFLLSNASAFAKGPVQVDFRCLESEGDKPIRLEWRVFTEVDSEWSGGYVRYEGSKKVIQIVLQSRESTETSPGRPYEFKSVWNEVVAGKVSGEYVVTTQGANVYGFVYKNYRTGRKTEFFQQNKANAKAGCKWN